VRKPAPAVRVSARRVNRPTSDIRTPPPAPQAFALSRSNHGNFQHFGTSGKTWLEACIYNSEKRSAVHKHFEQEEFMFEKPFLRSRGFRAVAAAAVGIALAFLGGSVFAAQDKYTLRVPNGLAFSDFRGYEDWQAVAVSQTEELLKVMVANPTMIAAYRAGVPGNGKPFPDGSKIAKIEWKPKKSTEAPFSVRVPETLQDVFFIEKNNKKFPDTKGWAYAAFDYDPASDTFKPDPAGAVNCGFACHTIVKAKDYIFTAYGKR
jgi:hypothetical protein